MAFNSDGSSRRTIELQLLDARWFFRVHSLVEQLNAKSSKSLVWNGINSIMCVCFCALILLIMWRRYLKKCEPILESRNYYCYSCYRVLLQYSHWSPSRPRRDTRYCVLSRSYRMPHATPTHHSSSHFGCTVYRRRRPTRFAAVRLLAAALLPDAQ